MYIRVKTTPLSPRRSVQIVEGIRKGTKVSQKILRHVGIAENEKEEQMLKDMAVEIIVEIERKREEESQQRNLFPPITKEEIKAGMEYRKGRRSKKRLEEVLPVSEVKLDEIVETDRVIEGIHEVGAAVYQSLGYKGILGKRDDQILEDLVIGRLGCPKSKHKLQEILTRDFGKEHDLDRIYRMMDKLFPRINAMKQKTFERTRNLFPEGINVLLFDVTTLYFESIETDGTREFGYSKDCRFNTTQVVLALATNDKGLPIGYELFAGNKAEVKTLVAAIDNWKNLFKIESVCFVGDRAMFARENLKLLEERGYNYVVAAKLRTLPKKLQTEFFDEKNYRITESRGDLTWIGEFTHDDRKLIVSYKKRRALKDAKDRQKMLDKLEKVLGAKGPTRKLLTNGAVKKFTKTDANSQTQIDQEKIAKDAIWDGLHGVITNLKDTDAKAILARYAELWVIEDSFRVNKHLLRMRPIYHWKPERIHAHIAICYMTFSVLRHLQYKVTLTQKISPAVIIEELMQVQASIHVHKKTGDYYRVPGKFTNTARKIYKALGLERNLDAVPYL